MTVGQLKELLEGYEDEAEVRLMTQSNYPFEYSIRGVASTREMNDLEGEETDPDGDVVYVVEGGQLGYGRKAAWEVIS